MSINWKRFTFGALVLASLALLLSGCGDFAGNTPAPNVPAKTLSGIVSDPATGLPLAGATVTAYPVDQNGVESTTPLSIYPVTATTDSKGAYRLQIPTSYTGALVVESKVSGGSALRQLRRALFVGGLSTIRAAVPANFVTRANIPPVMVSLATEASVEFIKQNYAATGFSSGNIKKSYAALENLFGLGFYQTAPPRRINDRFTSKAQQDLAVSIRAVNLVTSGQVSVSAAHALAATTPTLADIVASMLSANGMGNVAAALKNAIVVSTSQLAQEGTVPPEYVPSTVINTALSNAMTAPVTVPSVTDAAPPNAPTGAAASALAARKVRVTWNASTSNGVAGYAVCRVNDVGVAATVALVDTRGSSASSFTYFDLLAEPVTHYVYKVYAIDAIGNYSEASNEIDVTTPAPYDTVAPSTPVGLVCRGFNDKVVSLTWQASTKTNADGSVTPAAAYNVYRDYQLIATVPTTSYIDNTVSPVTSYIYFVKAADSDSNLSDASALLTVRTDASPTATAPGAPSGLTDTAAYNLVSMSWTASADAGVTYTVYRDGSPVAVGLTGLSYGDAAVTPNTGYHYTVTAVKNGGESVPSNVLTVTTPANPNNPSATVPDTPTNFVAVSVNAGGVSLMWNSSLVGGNPVTGYLVQRGDATGNNFVNIASTRVPGYTDTTVSPSTTYSYRVLAFSDAGIYSAPSAIWLAPVPAAVDLSDTTPPSAPAGVAASAPTSGSVVLTWTANSVSDGVAGYLVFRDGVQVANITTGTTFTDPTVVGGVTYSYTVEAYDAAGNLSPPSSAVQVQTPVPPPNTYTIYGQVVLNNAGLSGVMLTLTDASSNATTATSDQNGNFSFPAVPNGTYTLSASAAGFYSFVPITRTVTVAGANVTGQNFATVLVGTLNTGTTYPNGTIIGGISYGGVTIIGGVSYPTGTVIGGIQYPNGVIIGGVQYPPGTIVGGVAFPTGAVTTGVTYPSGTITNSIGFPTGVVIGGVLYPAGIISGGVLYPAGTVSGTIGYPSGSISGTLTW
ncbi:fibronectin type III domain-containing protein [Geomonas sp. Red32]|uniref:fibronectin type III domain-containing protein n=1 Tax=Geomonas sp. Red32 TaxID=2912856 RepID=UPI00202D06CD|nr:carboxypeptidase regulatory-like domain-containing protein [Geomonas sp. Red32]MCM0082546.1 fibronectin type III domain-containing protein [Geomonas sp. Red32]